LYILQKIANATYYTNCFSWKNDQVYKTRRVLEERIPAPNSASVYYIRRRFAIAGNGKVFFNSILDPDGDSDHHQNLIAFKCSTKSTFPENFSQICL